MKIKNILFKTILGILAFVLLWIILQGLLDYDTVIYEYNPIILAIGIIIYFFLIRIIYKKLLPKIENNKIIPVILIAIFTIICIVSGQILKVNPSWDMGNVYNISVDCAERGIIKAHYLYCFPNNIGITIVYSLLFRICKIIGITDYLTVATLFNSIVISLSVLLIYLITKKLFGNKKALMVLIISVFTTPLYLYSAIYYTDTLSMFMMLLMAYVFIIVKNINPEKKLLKILGYILLTIIIFAGMKIKVTAFFIVIAYLMYAIFNGKFKELGKQLLIVVPTFIVITIIYTSMVNIFITPDKEMTDELKYPIEVWIAMGLKGNGGYDFKEYVKVNEFHTYEEKQKAARESIKQILSEYDTNSFIKHLTAKLEYAWTDGSYFAPEKLRREPVNDTILHEFIFPAGKYNIYYKYLPQIMHMSMLIFILIGVCKTIKDKDFKDVNVIFYILMLGFIAFFLIWENRSRYILTCVPFLMIAQLKGIEIFSKYHSKENDKKDVKKVNK